MDERIERAEKQERRNIKDAIVDNRFDLLNSFTVTVPKDYNHDTQLSAFAKYAKEKKENLRHYNDNINDKNFEKATRKLMPGKTYAVKIFGIESGSVVTSGDCMDFLKTQKAVLVGAQGMSLAVQFKKEEFPTEKYIVSFDEEDALWEDAGGFRGVPCVILGSGGSWYFGLGRFKGAWIDGGCLLCFFDLPVGDAGK